MKNCKGFTLIELLVVVAIIGLLIAILVPSLGKVRRRTKTVLCSTNQRGLVQSYRMYFQASQNVLSSTGHGNQGAWDFQLLGGGKGYETPALYYANNGTGGSGDKIRFCPETDAQRRAPALEAGSAFLGWDCRFGPGGGSTGSYAMNNWVYRAGSVNGIPSAQNGSFYEIKKIQNDTVVPVFVDSIWHDIVPRQTDGIAYNTLAPATSGNDQRGTRSLADAVINRHEKKVVISYWDGHVEPTKLEMMFTVKWSRGWTFSQAISVNYNTQ